MYVHQFLFECSQLNRAGHRQLLRVPYLLVGVPSGTNKFTIDVDFTNNVRLSTRGIDAIKNFAAEAAPTRDQSTSDVDLPAKSFVANNIC